MKRHKFPLEQGWYIKDTIDPYGQACREIMFISEDILSANNRLASYDNEIIDKIKAMMTDNLPRLEITYLGPLPSPWEK